MSEKTENEGVKISVDENGATLSGKVNDPAQMESAMKFASQIVKARESSKMPEKNSAPRR